MCFWVYTGSPDSRPPAGGDEASPRPSEEGDVSKSDPPPLGQGVEPRLHGQEGGPESPKLGGEGDPITISDESEEGPPSTGDRVSDKEAKVPQNEGRTPWPIGLHAVEEEKRKKNEEEQRRKEEEEKKKREEEKQHLLEQQRRQQ